MIQNPSVTSGTLLDAALRLVHGLLHFGLGIVARAGAVRTCRTKSVGVGAFGLVLEDATGRGVDADFLGDRTDLDVERVAKPAPAALAFELFVGDPAGMRFQRDRSRLIDRDLGPWRVPVRYRPRLGQLA